MKLFIGDRVRLTGEDWTAKFTLLIAEYQPRPVKARGLTRYEAKEDASGDASFTVDSDGTMPFINLKIKKICRVYGVLGDEKIEDSLGQRTTVNGICRGCGFFISNCRCY